MERRVVDIAEGRLHLSKRRGSLVAARDPDSAEASETLLPFDEIESIIVHTPRASYSNSALVELARRGIPLVCCDEYHSPVAWLWSVTGHHEQTRRMAAQVAMSDELRGALWRRIVQAKISAQSELLRESGEAYEPLLDFGRRIEPGDSVQPGSSGRATLLEASVRRRFPPWRARATAERPAELRLRGAAGDCGSPALRRRAASLDRAAPQQQIQRILSGRRSDGAVPADSGSGRARTLAGRLARGERRNQSRVGSCAGRSDAHGPRRRAPQPLHRVDRAIAGAVDPRQT